LNVLSDGEGGRGLEVVPVLLGEARSAVGSVKVCAQMYRRCVLMGGPWAVDVSDGAANRRDSRVGALLQALLAL
jgi:hypothetical protein